MDYLIDEIFRRYDVTRYRNERLQQQRIDEVYTKVPLLKLLDSDISKKRTEMFRSSLNPDYDYKKTQQVIDQMIMEKRKLLKEAGFEPDYLEPVYQCPLCHDTGIDSKTNKRCVCFYKALQKERYKELKLDQDSASFENFDLSIFPDEKKSSSSSTQRKKMSNCYNVCKKYAESYPSTIKKNMIFIGASGLGKTYLLKCIARKVIDRNFACLFITAYNLFDRFRKQFLGEIDDLQDFYSAPLLIIDDLGTEPLMKNVTTESFFTLINERVNNNLHTLFATNLSPAEIKERYGERISSRLLSVNDTIAFELEGDDVRRPQKSK